MTELSLPALSVSPRRLSRSGFSWLHPTKEPAAARQPIASCYLRISDAAASNQPMPLRDEQNDLQVVLAPRAACTVKYREALFKGGYQALVEGSDWQAGECIGDCDLPEAEGVLESLVLAGRRGFENGEGRGGLLAGWHERVRGSWEGEGKGRFGTVLALGTCEQTAIFRGDDLAFLSWFARSPGPAQIISIGDDRCVHSSAVVLQHLRRTPAEASAIADAVYSWIGEHIGRALPGSFPAFQPQAMHGTLHGRWPIAQDLLYAMHLLAEAVGTSPILERSEVITRQGILQVPPPDAIAMTLGSEFAPHFRHRRTGWVIAIHGFRFGPFVGPAFTEWLRRDFEPLQRSVADSQRDLAALAQEVETRVGARLLVQNLVASSWSDRVSNYSWLGDAFQTSVNVLGNEANLMLSDLCRSHPMVAIDSDALAAEFGVNQVPDRFHASRQLVEAQRTEVHRVLRELQIPGF